MFKIGDKVRIKSYEEIKGGLKDNWTTINGLFFASEMKIFCGMTATVKEIEEGDIVLIGVEDIEGWYWDSEWLEHAYLSSEQVDKIKAVLEDSLREVLSHQVMLSDEVMKKVAAKMHEKGVIFDEGMDG